MYRKSVPEEGPPYFTAASSFAGSNRQDPHFRLSRALHVADWNIHDEASVNLIHRVGGDWAFYNGGNRWTYGTYLYKGAKQYGMKFRLAWHWNAAAGDRLLRGSTGSRGDDYAWCNAARRTVSSSHAVGPISGTLLRGPGRLSPAPDARPPGGRESRQAGRRARPRATSIDARAPSISVSACVDALFPVEDWAQFRRRVVDAIEALRK